MSSLPHKWEEVDRNTPAKAPLGLPLVTEGLPSHSLVGTCFVPGTMAEVGGTEINEVVPALRELTMSDEGVILVLSPNE